MLSLCVLGSGSSGNCAVLRTGNTRLLVDAGLSAKQIVLRLAQAGLEPGDLDGILLTHEHGDHTQGLEVLCRKFELPVYATPLTRESVATSVIQKARPRWQLMESGAAFELRDLRIECFSVPHDAADPVGFVIADTESRLGILSDVGFVTTLIRERLRGAHTLFVEANYDAPMLEADTRRPWSTKQRISGRHGHLSNEQAAELVQSVAHDGLHRVVLGHLSDDCNDPDVARKKIAAALHQAGCRDVDVHCAPRREPTPWLEVARRAAPACVAEAPPRPAQVELWT